MKMFSVFVTQVWSDIKIYSTTYTRFIDKYESKYWDVQSIEILSFHDIVDAEILNQKISRRARDSTAVVVVILTRILIGHRIATRAHCCI